MRKVTNLHQEKSRAKNRDMTNPSINEILEKIHIQNYWYMKLSKAGKKLYLTRFLKDFVLTTEKDLQGSSFLTLIVLTLFRMGPFGAAHPYERSKKDFPKICHTYPTMMKLGAVVPYLKQIQKINESYGTTP